MAQWHPTKAEVRKVVEAWRRAAEMPVRVVFEERDVAEEAFEWRMSDEGREAMAQR